MIALQAILFLPIAGKAADAEIHSIHQDLSVRLDPVARNLAVSAKITLDGKGALVMRLARGFVVTTFSIDGKETTPTPTGNKWVFNFRTGRRHNVSLQYHGKLAPSPAASGPLGISQPVASKNGSYLPAESAWHPSFAGHPFTYRLDIRVPEPQRAVAPGRLTLEESIGGDYHAVFEFATPLDGIVLMAGPYQITERHHGKIRLRTYFHPDIANLANAYLDSIGGYLDLYEKWIGPYPYSAFHVVSGLLPVGLGYPGLTFMGKRVLALPFIRFSSLGHEILHNWWGNGVGVDYPTGNWSEGLTTFMADYTFAKQRSEQEAKRMRIDWLRDYAALPPDRDHPVITFINRHHDAEQIIGYDKVAFIFHMLRRNIGSAAFDRGIRLFWRQHAFTIASWGDLQKAFEEASGHKLGTFFDQWLDQSGAPKLVLGQALAHGNKVSFTLRQPSNRYVLNVPVAVETKDRNEHFEAKIKGAVNRIEFTASSKVLGLTIDPDFDIFRHLGPAEAPPILRDVTLSPGTRTLILAGTAGTLRQSNIKQLATRLAKHLLDTDTPAETNDVISAGLLRAPMLVIGDTSDIRAFLSRHQLPVTPDDIRHKGTARVWASRRNGPDGTSWPMLVIEADTPKALQALLRPLPHYRRQGFVVFDGAKVIAKGVRPTGHGPLSVRFN